MSFRVHAHFFRYTETEVTRSLNIVGEWGGVLLRRVVGMGDRLISVENLLWGRKGKENVSRFETPSGSEKRDIKSKFLFFFSISSLLPPTVEPE